jgi:hypothetical protein
MTATDTHGTIEELLEAVFSVRSVPRLNNDDQLPLLYPPNVVSLTTSHQVLSLSLSLHY